MSYALLSLVILLGEPQHAEDVSAGKTRLAQLAKVTSPARNESYLFKGKPVKLTPHMESVCVVVRRGIELQDLERLKNLVRPDQHPKPIVAIDSGDLYFVSRAAFRPAMELKKLAANGAIPPLYLAYEYGNAILCLDGSCVVKLKDGKSIETLKSLAKKESLQVTAINMNEFHGEKGMQEAKDTYEVSPSPGSHVLDAFGLISVLSPLDSLDWAVPLFVFYSPKP